jgi:hypothetical protein
MMRVGAGPRVCSGVLCEDLGRDAVALERASDAGIGGDLDEDLDDLLLGGSAVEGDAQLPAEWLEHAERRRDGHGDERAGAGIEALGARPGIAERLDGGDPLEVLGVLRLRRCGPEEAFEAEAQKLFGLIERRRVLAVSVISLRLGGKWAGVPRVKR